MTDRRAAGSAARDAGYQNFRRYLRSVFTYAGTLSLAKELKPVADPRQVRIGDVWIRPGSPGHSVLVVDVAVEPPTGRKAFLLVQSFMPAQDIHLLRNPGNQALSPWYLAQPGKELVTPEYTFAPGELRRFGSI